MPTLHLPYSAILLVACAGTCGVAAPARAEDAPTIPPAATPLGLPVRLADAAPRFDAENAQGELQLNGIARNQKGDRVDAKLSVSVQAGTWACTGVQVNGYNRAQHSVSAFAVRRDGEKLLGQVTLVLAKDDKWPANDVTLTIDIAAELRPAPERQTDIRFWVNQAGSGRSSIGLGGGWSRANEANASGTCGGSLSPRWDGRSFTQGAADGDGLALTFAMGNKRADWNNAQVAVYSLPAPADWRSQTGLRVSYSVPSQRFDCSGSVWLREQDGSWYYSKACLPLMAASTTVDIPFSAFVEAEWVSPGSHMDEDYVLDLSTISHVAVGVVSGKGVGEVALKIDKIEHYQQAASPMAPAQVQVIKKRVKCTQMAILGKK